VSQKLGLETPHALQQRRHNNSVRTTLKQTPHKPYTNPTAHYTTATELTLTLGIELSEQGHDAGNLGRFMLVEGLNIKVADQETGELLRDRTLDSTREYQRQK
jgi:hypothetical protein